MGYSMSYSCTLFPFYWGKAVSYSTVWTRPIFI